MHHNLSLVILNLLAGEMLLTPLPPIIFQIPDDDSDWEDKIGFENDILNFDNEEILSPNPPPPYYDFDAMKTFGKYEWSGFSYQYVLTLSPTFSY